MRMDSQPGGFAKLRQGPREVQAELAVWVQVSPKEWVRKLRAWDTRETP